MSGGLTGSIGTRAKRGLGDKRRHWGLLGV